LSVVRAYTLRILHQIYIRQIYNIQVGVNFVKNPIVSLSLTLARNEKIKHCIRIKTPKFIVLKF